VQKRRHGPPWRSHGLTCVLLTAVFALAASAASAQQPFATDDAGVTDAGVVHLEVFNEFDRLQPALEPHRQQNTFNLRATYGIGRQIELNLDAPLLAVLNRPTVENAVGLGDTNIGLKYHWRDERSGYRYPAVAVAFYLETPTGNAASGLGSGLTDIWAYAVAQKTIRPKVVVRANLGYLFAGNTSTGVEGITTSRGHVVTVGTSVTRQVNEKIRLGGELTAAGTTNFNLDRGQLQMLLGGNVAVRQNLSLDVGIIAGHFAASPRYGVQIGFSRDFPAKVE
jgi:hypothetical protein